MPKKSQNRDNDALLVDDGKWDDIDDDGFTEDHGMDVVDLRLNVQARRLYDRYQEERRLRELLGDDYDF